MSRKSQQKTFFLIILSVSMLLPRLAEGQVKLRVIAGAHSRVETPVRWDVPEGVSLPADVELVRVDTGRSVPAQWDGDKALVWILPGPLAAGDVAVFEVIQRKDEPEVAVDFQENRHLLFKSGGKKVLRYNYGLVAPPSKIDPVFARSGYIHPIYSPSGRIVSNDFPDNHNHHHGIWFPWTNTMFEGRKVDFWNQKAKQGKVECVGLDGSQAGEVFGGFQSSHRFLDLTAPGGPKEVLKESWAVKVYALRRSFLADFTSVQECAGDAPLELKQYRYGGFGFRGSGQWEGEENCEYLTSEGKTRKDGHTTTSRWCAVYGIVDGATCGITFFCHPDNFRAPQNMRIHPKEPFFNYAPCQAGDFAIAPGKPYESRYRFVVYDGVPNVREMERLWNDYAEPPLVSLVR